MKRILLSLFFIVSIMKMHAQNVAINNDGGPPSEYAILDIRSTTKGVLLPRVTTEQRNAIVLGQTGMIVFDTDTRTFWYRNSNLWTEMSSGVNNNWTTNLSGNPVNRDSIPVQINGSNNTVGSMPSPLSVGRVGTPGDIENVITINRYSNSPVPGMGGSLLFRNQVPGGSMRNAARISAQTERHSPAPFESLMRFDVYDQSNTAIPRMYMNLTGISVGDNLPSESAVLDLQSDRGGLLVPRMDSTHRANIPNPAVGLLVFDNVTRTFFFWTGAGWREFGLSTSNMWRNSPFGFNYYDSQLPLVIGNTSSAFIDGSLNAVKIRATDNTLEDILSIQRLTSGTPATGIGGSIQFRHGSPTLGSATVARISSVSENQSNGINALQFTVYQSTTPITQLYVNNQGVAIGKTDVDPFSNAKLDVNGNIRLTAEVNRANTGSANLIPLLYGVVNATGNKLSGTSNFSSNRIATGHYEIVVTGENMSSTTDVISITPIVFNGARMTTVNSTGNNIRVFTYDANGALIDTQFNIIVYKM